MLLHFPMSACKIIALIFLLQRNIHLNKAFLIYSYSCLINSLSVEIRKKSATESVTMRYIGRKDMTRRSKPVGRGLAQPFQFQIIHVPTLLLMSDMIAEG